MPPKDKRSGSNEAKLWCIKVNSGAAYLYRGGKRVDNFLNIIGAESYQDSSDSVVEESGASPPKKKLKVIFKIIQYTFIAYIRL